MTDQPQEQQEQVPQEQQEQQEPRPTGMRFYVNLDDKPDAPTYMQPLSLHRFEETEETLILERFDKEGRKWVDNPALIAVTGLGGDESYKEVDEEEANRLIAVWTPDDVKAEDADAEPVPETGEEVGEAQVEGEAAEEDFQIVEPGTRDDGEYDLEWRPQSGEDHSEEVFGFLESMIEVSEEPAEEEEPVEEEEEKFTVRGLLRRIFNV